MIKPIEHVFVGDYVDTSLTDIDKTFGPPYYVAAGGDASKYNIRAYGSALRWRKGVFFISTSNVPGQEVLDTTDSPPNFRLAVFKNPGIVNDMEMVYSPVFWSTIDGTGAVAMPAAVNAFPVSGEDTYTYEHIQNTKYAPGYFLQITLCFKNIMELSPGEKYNIVTTEAKPSDTNPAVIHLNCFKDLVARINNNLYLSQFLTASLETTGGDSTFKVTAKRKEYGIMTLTPPERISFDMNTMMVENNGMAKGLIESAVSGANAMALTVDRGSIQVSDPRFVMQCEKRARGYTGVTNVTKFPIGNAELRTNLSATGYHWIYAPLIKRPYTSVEGLDRTSNEVVRVFFEYPSTSVPDRDVADQSTFVKTAQVAFFTDAPVSTPVA